MQANNNIFVRKLEFLGKIKVKKKSNLYQN